MKELRKESLKVRDEVLDLLKEISGYEFLVEYNDLYKVKDNYEVRRLKGWFGENERMVEIIKGSSWFRKIWSKVELREDVWKEYKNKLESIDFGSFKVELNSLRLDREDSYFKMVNNSGDRMFIIKIIYKDF
jgi:hypothetical protein